MDTNNFLQSIAKLFERDLRKLETEIASFADQESLWIIGGEIKNPAGNLALHLCGNLRHYIGHVLGNSSYSRNRDEEFSLRNVPKENLISQIRETIHEVSRTLSEIDPKVLEREYPTHVFDYKMTTMYFLIHLHGHLNYHLGQINYVRRLTVK
jgi:uncharacterized damage-inducible protein DinB